MAKKEKEGGLDENEIKQVVDADGDGVADSIQGFPYGLKTALVKIGDSPYHKGQKGKNVRMGLSVAKKLEANNWGEIVKGSIKDPLTPVKEAAKALLILAVFGLFSVLGSYEAKAQVSVDKALYNASYSNRATDTVTNTGTAVLASGRIAGQGKVSIQVNCTEISGTTGGTITLLGSLDGTNFKAVPTAETQTSVTTATAADVTTQTFIWRLNDNPFLYYRVSWAGTGTMSATIGGRIMKH